MAIFFTSDLHIGHENVIKYCDRPFNSVEEMNQEIVKRWNQRISPHDTVWCLGDLTLMSYQQAWPILSQLNGKKFLIKGNHDKFSVSQYNKLGFTVLLEAKLKMFGKTFRLSHYPYKPSWLRKWFCFPSELRFLEHRPPKIKGEWLLHGHTHSPNTQYGNSIHVGVDAWNFFPVSLKELESVVMSKK
jgi:calcineurin-like phosphoesterase family protein